jgi:hypothetical protein
VGWCALAAPVFQVLRVFSDFGSPIAALESNRGLTAAIYPQLLRISERHPRHSSLSVTFIVSLLNHCTDVILTT